MVGVARSAGTSPRRFGKGAAGFAVAGIVACALLWGSGLPIKELLARFTVINPVAENALADVQNDLDRDHATVRGDIVNSSSTHEAVSGSPLRLLSTWTGRNAHEGTAQLGTGSDNVRMYVAGALLSDGTRLAEIHRDSVVLTRGGHAWPLRTEESPEEAPVRGSNQPPFLTSDQPHTSPADSLSHEPLTDFVRPSPVYDKTAGALLGYEVYPGVNEQAFKQMGLQPGDVILAIDHVPLNKPAAIDLLRQLTRGIAVTATVQRNGRSQEIALNGAVTDGDSRAHRS